jgi:hypothetical protein
VIATLISGFRKGGELMKSVLDVPAAALLGTNTLGSLVDEFCTRLRLTKPDIICLPLIDYGGANYSSEILGSNSGPWGQFDFLDLAEEVKSYGCELYVSIIPTMNFLETSGLQSRTQYGRESSGVCITNPASQRLIRACIDEAVSKLRERDIPTAGIILGIGDINGMSAADKRIKLTCLCKYCTDALSKLGRFDYSIFKPFPNPINLFLKETPTGISNITIDLRHVTHRDVIELSKEQGVYDPSLVSDANAEKWASSGLDYCEARCKVTASAVQEIGAKCRAEGIKFGVITGFPYFDFTAGTDIWHLTSKVVDQVWTDTADLTRNEIPPGVAVYHYLSGRARYRIDAYFAEVSDTGRLRAMASQAADEESPVMDLIRRRGTSALTVNQLSRANAAALEFQDAFEGYVGVPLNDFNVSRINDAVQLLLPQLVPESSKKGQTSAAEVIMFLMRLAQSGRPIDMQVLTQVAGQLGLFANRDEAEH